MTSCTWIAPTGCTFLSLSLATHEVEPPARLVFTITDQAGDGPRDVCTLELTDLGDGRTEMRFEQRGGMTPEQYEAAKRGWGGFFDRIAERLAAPT